MRPVSDTLIHNNALTEPDLRRKRTSGSTRAQRVQLPTRVPRERTHHTPHTRHTHVPHQPSPHRNSPDCSITVTDQPVQFGGVAQGPFRVVVLCKSAGRGAEWLMMLHRGGWMRSSYSFMLGTSSAVMYAACRRMSSAVSATSISSPSSAPAVPPATPAGTLSASPSPTWA